MCVQVFVNFTVTALLMYGKVSIARASRELLQEKALLLCGVVTQIGSLVGAFAIFGAVQAGHFEQPSC